MAEGKTKSTSNLASTLWSVLMLLCVLLVIGHLVEAVTEEVVSEEELIEQTFTRLTPEE